MARIPQTSREVGFYFALAQVGFEFVIPMGIGLYLDSTFGWAPWGLIVGGILGFVGGLFHLISLVNRRERESQKPGEGPRP